MNDVAEDFEDDFENHKAIAAHRLRCLSDVAEGTILHIYDDSEMVALFVDDRFFIDADQIELVAQNTNTEEEE
jgi:hypothetical protein